MCQKYREGQVNGETSESDEELLERFISGNEEAFAKIVERHQTRVYNISYGIVRNRTIAEDITEETFIKLFLKAHTFKGLSKFTTWLHSIAANTAKNYLKTLKRRSLEVNIEDIVEIKNNIVGPEKNTEATILNERINQALRKLPDRQREVFIMRHINGFTVKETAEMLDISSGAVKANLSFALSKLRDL
ncbi:MAG TPA: RNA polymerase sigma factor, partial [Firmicutes bacterium]|nr:RNA polymerase sigma factor [Bacillota bacterium]